MTKIQLKSAITRVARLGNTHKITGFVLTDGTAVRSVEVKIDDGSWMQAELDSAATKYSWKLFQYQWNNDSPGEHTIVSRVTDVNGNVQLTEEQMPQKINRWENYGQFPRTLVIAA